MPFWKRSEESQRVQYTFVLVPPDSEHNARVVMADYFSISLFKPREDQNLDDETAVKKAEQIRRYFVVTGDDQPAQIEFLESFKTRAMPIGVGRYRPVLIRLGAKDCLMENTLLQPATKTQPGAVILGMIIPVEKTRAGQQFPAELAALRERRATETAN